MKKIVLVSVLFLLFSCKKEVSETINIEKSDSIKINSVPKLKYRIEEISSDVDSFEAILESMVMDSRSGKKIDIEGSKQKSKKFDIKYPEGSKEKEVFDSLLFAKSKVIKKGY